MVSTGSCLAFDLDGTLIDSAQSILTVLNDVRTERGFPLLRMDEIRPHLSKGGRQLVALALAEAAWEPDPDLALFRSRYKQLFQGPELIYPRVEETLNGLVKCGWTLGIATNKPTELARNALDHTGLGRFFAAVVTGNEGFPEKPHPAILLECCRRLGAGPPDVIFVGDSGVDANTAANAGCPFVYVEYGYPVGPRPGNVIASLGCLSGLPELLGRPTIASTFGSPRA